MSLKVSLARPVQQQTIFGNVRSGGLFRFEGQTSENVVYLKLADAIGACNAVVMPSGNAIAVHETRRVVLLNGTLNAEDL